MVSVIFHFGDREPLGIDFNSLEEVRECFDLNAVAPEQDSIITVRQKVYEAGEIIENITHKFNQKNLVHFVMQENVGASAHERMLVQQGFVEE